MIQDYAESPLCPNCNKPLVSKWKVPEAYAYFPPTKHQCRRCKIAVMSWILLIADPVETSLQIILPLNYTNYDNKPHEFWVKGIFNRRELLVLTEHELASETMGSDSITIEDILGLYNSALRAQYAN